ncbi:SDR family NAD(P)-dependent oxidoreductase [Imhoffiella purpurea]|uniref:Retinol dehydrogenase 13 n=1 Tax=Imhoffiella purpurea TaxID=1249627 RepID=W9VBF4_9GAMM|nr:SDR family NAD(P)-dependent oxidoreductase [Imhoffiella purpurea]EXJ16774.1 Retinol dehydrogenase 13 [Imhoffiella purpurea]
MNQSVKTAVVTGANSGLGKAIAGALARQGYRVGMVVRNRTRGEAALAEIRATADTPDIHLFVADLADQGAIRRLAEEILERFERLHLLVNNAGTAFPHRRPSPDGIESALAVNHLAPFLLTHLLLERLAESAPARIVNVGTRIDTAMDLSDPNWERRPYRLMQAYGQSKLGNLHFTFELARRLAGSGVTVNCVFPGIFRSNLGGTDGAQGRFWRLVDILIGWALPSPDKAARPIVDLAVSPEWEGVSGRYLTRGKDLKAPAQARDAEANRQVWEMSERMTGLAKRP